MDATQLNVTKDSIEEVQHKYEKFLRNSWANMADQLNKGNKFEEEISDSEHVNFQLVVSKTQ